MVAQVQNAALKRMVRNRPRRVSGAPDLIAQVLPKTAARTPGVELSVEKIAVIPATLADVLAIMSEDMLAWRLEGGGTGGGGLALADLAFRASLIEVMTTGGVAPHAPPSRRATAVDCRLVSHVVDDWCAAISVALPDDLTWRVRSGPWLAGEREIEHSVEDAAFQLVDLAVRFGSSARTGRLALFLKPERTELRPDDFSEQLRSSLLAVPREITVVATRERISLSRIAGLKPGDVLPLPGLSLDRVSVEAPIGRGCCVAHLGQSRGFRAIKFGPADAIKLAGSTAEPQKPDALSLSADPLPEPLPLGDQP